mmetsp:Transcript_3848/g.4792  ORF Transcript_3848/g.4792 Transcript_3848/m.4792 type:complete len:92 (-) Transcript_3848:910-1185(-)
MGMIRVCLGTRRDKKSSALLSRKIRGKPLFREELEVLWPKFPEYNSNNTIAVENGWEKVESRYCDLSILVSECNDYILERNGRQKLTFHKY